MSFFRVRERKTTFLLVLQNQSECIGERGLSAHSPEGKNKTQACFYEKPAFL